MVYTITDQRAISIEGSKSITVKSYLPADMASIERVEHADGSGDLVLRSEQYRDSEGDQRTRQSGFFAIDNVRRVERLVESLVRTSRA